MLVKDLRKEVSKYNKDDIIDIAVQLYKLVPKGKYDLDKYIINKYEKKTVKVEIYNIETLNDETTAFLYCVNNDYYASPNKVIDKSERSKWQFKVKNITKR